MNLGIGIGIGRGAGRDPSMAYTGKVKALSPIAYWPLAEASGSTALDASGNGRDGAYTGVTLGASGIGDGRSAASFDGSTSRANVFSASLAAAFSGAAGTVCGWARMSGSGVWSDATNRYLFELNVNAQNRVSILRSTTNGVVTLAYRGGNVLKQLNTAAQSSLAFLHYALTWDTVADQVKAYLNGAQIGATQTTLTPFTGTPAVAVIGAQTAVPAAVWSGTIAHVALWNTALSGAQIASLASAA